MSSLATILLVSFATFLLLHTSTSNVAYQLAGENASSAEVAEVEHRLGLDRPIIAQYGSWLKDAAHGDFGASFLTSEPVTHLIGRALPATLSLLIVAAVLAVLIAIAAALAAARRPDGLIDRLIMSGTTVALAVPSFWLAILLVQKIAVDHRWFPAVGYVPLSDGVGLWASHIALPSLVLTAHFASEVARQLRTSLQDVSRTDYMLSARMRGLSRWRVLAKHGLKPAALPAVTIFGVRVAQLLGGTVVIERVFNLNGLGSLLLSSVLSHDISVVLGVVLTFAVIVIFINFLVDLTQSYFDPRTRKV